jgi:thiol-disulfide isomerase/thioredoxin
MALLSEQDQKVLREHFDANLDGPVELLYFSQTIACNYCKETEQILQEGAALSDKITVTVKNFVTDKDVAEQYGIDKIPATVVRGAKDYGIRYYGIPSATNSPR